MLVDVSSGTANSVASGSHRLMPVRRGPSPTTLPPSLADCAICRASCFGWPCEYLLRLRRPTAFCNERRRNQVAACLKDRTAPTPSLRWASCLVSGVDATLGIVRASRFCPDGHIFTIQLSTEISADSTGSTRFQARDIPQGATNLYRLCTVWLHFVITCIRLGLARVGRS